MGTLTVPVDLELGEICSPCRRRSGLCDVAVERRAVEEGRMTGPVRARCACSCASEPGRVDSLLV